MTAQKKEMKPGRGQPGPTRTDSQPKAVGGFGKQKERTVVDTKEKKKLVKQRGRTRKGESFVDKVRKKASRRVTSQLGNKLVPRGDKGTTGGGQTSAKDTSKQRVTMLVKKKAREGGRTSQGKEGGGGSSIGWEPKQMQVGCRS